MMWGLSVHARVSMDRVGFGGVFFFFLTSLSFGGVMYRIGSIAVVICWCDGIDVSRSTGAPSSGGFVPDVCPCPVYVLNR